MKLVSVVMPVFNGAKHLVQTLESLSNQSYSHWELIAVDDCSTDDSVSILKSFGDGQRQPVQIFSSPKSRSGASVCRNIGVKESKGDYLLFLDSDDLLEAFCLEYRVATMARVSTDWAVFNQYAWHPPELPKTRYNKPVQTRQQAIDFFLKMDSPWQTMAVLWKRDVIEELKGFDEALYFMEDPDLHLRALLNEKYSVHFETNATPDCLYRMPVITEENAKSFYHNGIKSRFGFLSKLMLVLLLQANTIHQQTYRHAIRLGFFDFVRVYLLSRFRHFAGEFTDALMLLRKHGVLSSGDVVRLRLLKYVFISESVLIRIFKLKGIAATIFLK